MNIKKIKLGFVTKKGVIGENWAFKVESSDEVKDQEHEEQELDEKDPGAFEKLLSQVASINTQRLEEAMRNKQPGQKVQYNELTILDMDATIQKLNDDEQLEFEKRGNPH